MTRLAAVQIRIDIDRPAETRAAALAAVAEAAARGAELVVLPELVLSGAVFVDAAEANAHAEEIAGAGVELLRETSRRHGIVLVAGVCESSGGPRPYNTAVVVDRGEVVAVYRKTHLWDREKLLFTPGDELPPVVATGVGQVAAMVCYDLEFPEMVRSVALRGAQVIAVPANWPDRYGHGKDEAPEIINARAAAATNRLAVVVADRTGIERGVDWIGGSLICDVEGRFVAAPATGRATVLVADVDLTAALDKRLGPHNDALSDRRTDLYGA